MRILIVDDLEANRILLSHLVTLNDYEPMPCASAEEALQSYHEYGADVIFMDVVMPGTDGYSAAKQLKEVIGDFFVPIIFITALQDEDALVRCLEFGDDYLVRPFNQIMFNAKIAAHIRTIELQRKAQKQHKELTYLHSHMIQEQEMAQHVFDHATQINYQNCKSIETYISSASQFNGDVLLVAKSPAGGVYIMLGDFTGHGLPAALGSLPISQSFHYFVRKQLSVGDLAREMNRVLVKFLPDYMFCAAVIGELNAAGDKIKLWTGGLHDSLILDHDFKIQKRIPSQHMPLGILEDREFDAKCSEFYLRPDNKLILYTDGILEASNQAGELFGRSRFESVLLHSKCDIDVIRQDLYNFMAHQVGEYEQDDDISLVCINAGEIIFTEDAPGTLDEGYLSQRSALPWSISVELDMKQLRLGSPVSQLIDMVGEALGLYRHKPTLLLLLTEMFNNALEHGVLGLDSHSKETPDGMENYYQERHERLQSYQGGSINIQIIHELSATESAIKIRVQDSGEGFDHSGSVIKEKNEQNHGRGLSLLRELCEEVNISESGRCIEATFIYS